MLRHGQVNGELTGCGNTPVPTFDANDGIIPVAGITLNWYDAPEGGSVIASPTLNSVSSVSYYAEASNGVCISTTRTKVVLTIYPAPSAPIAGIPTQPSCDTAPTGSVDLSGLPSTGTWTINPGGVTGTGTSAIISNLVAGRTYNFRVTDAAGCTSAASTDVVINAQPLRPILTIRSLIDPLSCGDNGSIVLNLINVPDGSYSISSDEISFNGVDVSGGIATIQAKTNTYHNLQITVNGCTSVTGVNATLKDSPAPSAPLAGTPTQADCVTPTGSVELSGLPAGTWTINPGSVTGTGTSAIISNLVAGRTYNFKVTNAAGCTSAASNDVVIIVQPPTLSVALIGSIVQPTCSKPTGSVFLSGLPSGNWIINPGTIAGTGDTLTISGLVAGTYNYTITNEAGCTSPGTVDVVINTQPLTPPKPVVSVTQNPKCNNPDGTVTITQPSGAEFEYSIDGGVPQASPVFPGLKTNVYIFRVRNKFTGCESDTTWKSVPAIPPAPTMLIPVGEIQNCLCYDGKGSFTIYFTGVPDGSYTIFYD